MSAERKHHEFSPSQLQALECCPSYGGISSENEKARLGTMQHAAAESGQDNAELSDEQADAVSQAILFVNTQRMVLEEEAARAGGGEIIDLSEVYLPVDAEETTGGYADSLLVSHDRKRAVLTDFKFGQWGAEIAENNLQGIAYSLGAFFRFPTLEKVEVHFFQPALTRSVNSAVWTQADVPALLLRVKTVVARAKLARSRGDFKMVNPTVPGCLFCSNLALCPAVTSLVLRTGHKFHPVDVPNEITPSMVHDSKNSTMGMRLASLVTVWAQAFRSLTTCRVLRGDAPVPDGYAIAQGSGKRKIIDSTKFKTTALQFISEDTYNASTEPQLGRIEKAIKDGAPRGQKDSTLDRFKDSLLDAGAVEKGRSFPYLKAKTSEDSEAVDDKEYIFRSNNAQEQTKNSNLLQMKKSILLIVTLLAATGVAGAAEKGAEKLTRKNAKKNHGTFLQSHFKQIGGFGPFQVHSLRIRGLDSPNASAAVIYDPRSETYTVVGPATGAGLGSAILGAAGNVGSSAVFGLSLRPTRINENISNNSESEGSSSTSEGGDANSVSKSAGGAGGNAVSISDADAKSSSSSVSSVKNSNSNRNSSVNSNRNSNNQSQVQGQIQGQQQSQTATKATKPAPCPKKSVKSVKSKKSKKSKH